MSARVLHRLRRISAGGWGREARILAAAYLVYQLCRTMAMGLVWGPLVSVSTVVTANHFLIDLGAGLAVTAAGLVVGLALSPRAISPMRPARRTERLTPSSISTGGR